MLKFLKNAAADGAVRPMQCSSFLYVNYPLRTTGFWSIIRTTMATMITQRLRKLNIIIAGEIKGRQCTGI